MGIPNIYYRITLLEPGKDGPSNHDSTIQESKLDALQTNEERQLWNQIQRAVKYF